LHKAIQQDPRRGELLAILAAWRNAYGNEKKSGGEIIEGISSLTTTPALKALKAALIEAGAVGKAHDLSSRVLGKYLTKHKERRVSSLEINDMGMLDGSRMWAVSKVE
jgi:hypothetical protein